MIFSRKLKRVESDWVNGVGRFFMNNENVGNCSRLFLNLLKILLEFRLLIVLKSLFLFFKVCLREGRGLLLRSKEVM